MVSLSKIKVITRFNMFCVNIYVWINMHVELKRKGAIWQQISLLRGIKNEEGMMWNMYIQRHTKFNIFMHPCPNFDLTF